MVSEKDVAYVADLANLELTADERERMLKDLNSILGYIERLNQLTTDDVEPMAQVASRYSAGAAAGDAMRSDDLRPSLPHDEAMKNAPQTDGTFFKVPKVIEK
jgi:aspartyl-tRNA(Asn)/glutamyl-tRNA(Gln) amidotransferase subunit C